MGKKQKAKKVIALSLAVVMLLLLFTGCGGNADEGENVGGENGAQSENSGEASGAGEGEKVLRVGWYTDASTLDAQNVITSDSDYDMQRMLTERLVRNTGGEFTPGVAETWESSDDGMVWTFHLRESTYADGTTPVTAEDFVYAFRRLVDPENPKEAATFGFIIKNAEAIFNGETPAEELGVVAKDDYTLEVTLENPAANFLYVICDWMFAPLEQSFVEECGELYGTAPEYYLSNGPFTLTEWVRGSQLTLSKNPSYWDAEHINIDTMNLIVGASYQTAVDLMLAGDLDVCRLYSYDYMLDLQDICDVTGYDAGYQFCHINHSGKTEETGKFLSNANFRKALIYAVSREDIVNSVFTNAVPSTRITSPNVKFADGTAFNDKYPLDAWPAASDPAKAQEYLDLALEELGCTKEDLPTFTFMCYESENSMTIMQAIMDMLLTNLGIESVLDSQAEGPLYDKYYAGDWDFFWSGCVFEEPDWLNAIAANFYSNSSTNYTGYNNPKLDELYLQCQAAPDMETRYELLFEIEKLLCDDALGILIGWSQTYHCANPNVSGYVCYGGYTNYTYADIN